MANANKANKATATKTAAPVTAAPVTAGATVATTQVAKGTPAQQAATPQAPLFTTGGMPPVRGGTHRAYAQAIAAQMAKANPKGFTLAAYRAALVAGAAASSIAPPSKGWAVHNMPTWASAPAQQWLVPA
jgi:hypothetical protein